jgi:CheY-like chemotaxis protein
MVCMTMSKLQLLSVEDSEPDAEVTARALRKAGLIVDIRRVQTEHDFMSALRESTPDLILSDFSLPQFDGLRALELAAAHAPEIPFIYVSGTIGEERAIEGAAARCDRLRAEDQFGALAYRH